MRVKTLRPQKQAAIDGRGLVWGLVLGSLVGGLVALFKAPLLRTRMSKRSEAITVKQGSATIKTETSIPADPVAESRAHGRAAAHRRRSELGI